MAKNVFFTQGTISEQRLVQDLVDEHIKIHGLECYYIPRRVFEDKLWNDIYYSEYKDSYLIEMYLESYEKFGGKGDILSKFGLRVTDEITLTVSRRRWKDFVDVRTNKIVQGRPNEGDLIYFPLNNNVFEIKYVENQEPFYQLNNLYVYTLTCEVFEYGDSIFDTGIEGVDNLTQETGGYPITFSGGTGDFSVGETVSGVTSGSIGTIASWDPDEMTAQVVYTKGTFVPGETINGLESSSAWSLESFDTLDLIDAYSDNRVIEDNADNILDFTETNPFGEYSNLGDNV